MTATKIYVMDESILDQVPKACDESCPLNGIPMNLYLGSGTCSSCKFNKMRVSAYDKYFASGHWVEV